MNETGSFEVTEILDLLPVIGKSIQFSCHCVSWKLYFRVGINLELFSIVVLQDAAKKIADGVSMHIGRDVPNLYRSVCSTVIWSGDMGKLLLPGFYALEIVPGPMILHDLLWRQDSQVRAHK